jgi:hypothetical protein
MKLCWQNTLFFNSEDQITFKWTGKLSWHYLVFFRLNRVKISVCFPDMFILLHCLFILLPNIHSLLAVSSPFSVHVYVHIAECCRSPHLPSWTLFMYSCEILSTVTKRTIENAEACFNEADVCSDNPWRSVYFTKTVSARNTFQGL